nr:sesquiterpene synthase [Phanerodontia chrysosporium]
MAPVIGTIEMPPASDGFGNPAKISPTHERSEEESLPYLCRYVITEFLRRAGIQMPTFNAASFGDEVDRLTFAEVAKWDIGNANPRRLHHHVVSAINIAKTAYAHTPVPTQVHIAMWTALCIFVDDFEIETAAVEQFAERFHAGGPQLHPLLDVFAGTLRAMPRFFHAHGAAGIVANTVQYVTSTLFDKVTEEKGLEVHASARDYPLYKRARNGIGEGYGFCIFDKENFPDVSTHIQVIPEAITYLIYVNDLLSFYKEELDGETKNFIHDRARVTGKDIEAALMDSMEDVIDAVNRGRQILQGEKERKAWDSFLVGYVAFHFISPRYKLERLLSGMN